MQTLPVQIKLSGNPFSLTPTYSKEVSLTSGEVWTVADPCAHRAMIALMDMQAVLGGAASHYGGPAAFAEIVSSVHGVMFREAEKMKVPWHSRFHWVNDAGHCENGLYALRANYKMAGLDLESLKGFRSIKSPLTGHGESHLFPEGVLISNGPLGSAVSPAQGLAQGDALKGNFERITVLALSDGAAMEGEAKEGFAALPGFAKRGLLAPFVMILSDNQTKLSGRIKEQSYDMDPTFDSLESLGWKRVKIKEGHNLSILIEQFLQVFDEVRKNPKVPIVLQVQTIKGKGVLSAESSSTGAHGFPVKSPKDLEAFINEIYLNKSFPSEFKNWINDMVDFESNKNQKKLEKSHLLEEKVQDGFSRALVSLKEEGYPILSITSDLPGSTGVSGFQKKFPESSLDVGIAESNMIGVAAGLSLSGFIPIVDTFAQFGVTKGALPLTMASLSQAPVIALFSHAGFQDAADGASHQALSYFSMVSSIPHVEVYSVCCSEEAESLLKQTVIRFSEMRKKDQIPPSTVFFFGRELFPAQIDSEDPILLGQARRLGTTFKEQQGALNSLESTLSKGRRLTLLSCGPLTFECLKASEILKEKQIDVCVVQATLIQSPDTETLARALTWSDGNLMTVEDHQIIGGMGAMALQALMNKQILVKKYRGLGVKGSFGQSAYEARELYEKHGLDGISIAQEILEYF